MLLIDTDVMVAVLRGYAPAVAWLRSLGAEPIGVPGLVAMELLQGCRDRAEQLRVETILRSYDRYWPNHSDCERAVADFAGYHLSHNLGILDALIAETAVGVRAELVTFNARHYGVVDGLRIVQPYEKG